VEAETLRTMENGLMNVTETGVPFRNTDETWLVRGVYRREREGWAESGIHREKHLERQRKKFRAETW